MKLVTYRDLVRACSLALCSPRNWHLHGLQIDHVVRHVQEAAEYEELPMLLDPLSIGAEVKAET